MALLTVQVLFGLLPVATKWVLPHLDPLPLTALRIGAAALIMLYLHPFVVRDAVPWREAPRVFVLGLLGIAANQALFVVGLARTTAINATLIITTIPVFTYVVALLLGKENLGPRRAAGIILAFGGVLYLLGMSRFQAGASSAIGDLLVALNCLSFSVFLVLARPMAQRYEAMSLTTGYFLAGALILVPLGWSSGLPEQSAAMPGAAWLVMAFIVIGPTVAAYALNNTALRTVPASTVAVFIYLQPIIATLTAAWLLDEEVSWRLLPAAALVFSGLWLVTRKGRTANVSA